MAEAARGKGAAGAAALGARRRARVMRQERDNPTLRYLSKQDKRRVPIPEARSSKLLFRKVGSTIRLSRRRTSAGGSGRRQWLPDASSADASFSSLGGLPSTTWQETQWS